MHEILARPAKILTQAQRQDYFEQGFIGVQKLVDATWLERLQGVTSEFIERSRDLEGKDRRFDLEASHTANDPRIRRLNSPVELHDTY